MEEKEIICVVGQTFLLLLAVKTCCIPNIMPSKNAAHRFNDSLC